MKVTYDRTGCKSFFKKHKNLHSVIEKMIQQAIQVQLETGMSKVKIASPVRIAGQSIYEFHLNLKQAGSVRVAFAVKDEQILVVLITSNLQKDSFSRELETTLKGSHYAFGSR